MGYEEFRQQYEQQHPASVPVKPQRVGSEYPGWLRGVVLLMFASAALVSGAHTVPTVYAGIESAHVADWVRQIVALAAFVAIDIAVFVATYARLRGNRRTVTAMLVVVFAVALISNVNSVLRAFGDVTVITQGAAQAPDLWTTVVGIILGIGAPLIALLAGEMFVHMHTAASEANAQAEAVYRDECKAFDAVVLREYRKAGVSQSEHGVSDTRQADRQALPASEVSVRPDTDSLQTRQTAYGYQTTSDGQQTVIRWLNEHPEDAKLGSRPLGKRIGVSHDTANKGRQEWQRQQQLAPSVSTNGNGAHHDS